MAGELSTGFPTDRDGINPGHPGFETNTVHRCVENHILLKIGKFLLFIHSWKKKKKVKVVTWDQSFCDFSVWLNLKWNVTGPRSLRANEKFGVHCYRTELNPSHRKVAWELVKSRNLVSCKYLIKYRINALYIDRDWPDFNYFSIYKSHLGERARE